MAKKEALILYSGGRDSSAAIVEMIREGYLIKAFTLQLIELTGPNGDSAPDIRYQEIKKAFPEQVDADRFICKNLYLIKKLAIDRTNTTEIIYPLAAALAIHVEALLYCLNNKIENICSGYSGYQANIDRYVEQRSDFFEKMKSFLNEYGVNYHAPIKDKTKDETIEILDMCGISSNSLESKSIFIGGPFDINKVNIFWEESLAICREYINYKQSFPKNHD
jgi:7-cyano-7-deazaguanine synthase in queuosine biosynthesis